MTQTKVWPLPLNTRFTIRGHPLTTTMSETDSLDDNGGPSPPQEEKKDAAVTLDTEHWFPPRPLCDFVVHYEGHSFFVHKIKLHERSGYFRTYLNALRSPHKRQKREEEKKEEESMQCCPHGHDPDIACMELPGIERRFLTSRFGDRPKIIAADIFLGFLYALYFPSNEPYFPFEVKVRPTLGEQADDVDGTQTYPDLKAGFRDLLTRGVNGNLINTRWLDLAVYLGCSTLLTRADTVIHGGPYATMSSNSAWSDVQVSLFYGLQTAKEKGIGVILADPQYQSRKMWKEYEKDADINFYQALFAGAMARLHPGASR